MKGYQMAKGERNGTLRIIIAIVAILLTLGGVLWGLAIRSENLNRVVADMAKVDTKIDNVSVTIDRMANQQEKMQDMIIKILQNGND